VRPHHTHQLPRQHEVRGLGKRFEAGELDGLKAHGRKKTEIGPPHWGKPQAKGQMIQPLAACTRQAAVFYFESNKQKKLVNTAQKATFLKVQAPATSARGVLAEIASCAAK